MVIDPVGRPDPHVFPNLSERGRIASLTDRLANEFQGLLLALGQPLHGRHRILNRCWRVKFAAKLQGTAEERSWGRPGEARSRV